MFFVQRGRMRYILSIAILCFAFNSKAQGDSSRIDLSKYQKVYMDTGWVFVLKDLEKKEKDSYYYYARRKVKKMYPFALYAVDLLRDIDGNYEDEMVGKTEKRNARKANAKLKADFRQTILDLSEKDGDFLCKLIHRETGMTAYEIIKTYRGKAKAVYWQSIARIGGADLKQTFDPRKDLALNRVMKDVDAGRIKIPKEPNLITKEERKAKNKRYRANKRKKRKGSNS